MRVGLSQNYSNMQDSLWYPPATVGTPATVTPYDNNNLEVPRAMGGTCYAMPLMQAYNQFSANTSLPNYNPRRPRAMPGQRPQGSTENHYLRDRRRPEYDCQRRVLQQGPYNSYYNIRYNSGNPGGSQFPTGINGYSDNASTVTSQIYSICNQILRARLGQPAGLFDRAKPVLIHCLGFGP